MFFALLHWGIYCISISAAVCLCPQCFSLKLAYKLRRTKSTTSEASRRPAGRNKGNSHSADSISACLNLTQQHFRFNLDGVPAAPVSLLTASRTVCTFGSHLVTSSAVSVLTCLFTRLILFVRPSLSHPRAVCWVSPLQNGFIRSDSDHLFLR